MFAYSDGIGCHTVRFTEFTICNIACFQPAYQWMSACFYWVLLPGLPAANELWQAIYLSQIPGFM